MDSVAARPDELVICNCTELSSAHVRSSPMPDEDPTESLITQALFGDASVTMLMGSAPDGAGVQFLRTHTEQLYDQHQMMSLNIGNQSFWMTLAAGVPTVLQENIEELSCQTPAAVGTVGRRCQPLGNSPRRSEDPAGARQTVGVGAGAITGELGRARERRKLCLGHGAPGTGKHSSSR